MYRKERWAGSPNPRPSEATGEGVRGGGGANDVGGRGWVGPWCSDSARWIGRFVGGVGFEGFFALRGGGVREVGLCLFVRGGCLFVCVLVV